MSEEIARLGEKDIAISSLKNEIFYLKKERDELNDAINKYNNEILFLKSNLDSSKQTMHADFEQILVDKDNAMAKIRKEASLK